MTGFVKLEGEFAITTSRGVYKQADLYERNGYLYVKHGSGFIMLTAQGGTSTDKVRLDELNLASTRVAMGRTGRLCVEGHPAVPDQTAIPEPGEKKWLTRADVVPKLS